MSNTSKVCDRSVEMSNEGAKESSEASVNPVGVPLSKSEKTYVSVKCCVLQTAKVNMVNDQGERVQVTVIFDTGSDRSYVILGKEN